MSARPSFVGAQGIPEPLSRFELAEQMRRRGFPLAMPQGWDGKQIPRLLFGAPGVGPDGRFASTRTKPAPSDLPLAPDFFDENQRRGKARLGSFEILSPHRDVRAHVSDPTDTQVPFGEKLQCEEHEPAVTPLGAVIECDEAALWWKLRPDRHATAEPPQTGSSVVPIPIDRARRAMVMDEIRSAHQEGRVGGAVASEPSSSPAGVESRTPPAVPKGDKSGACAASPDWTSPPVAFGAGGGGAGPPSRSGGGGGGEPEPDEPQGPMVLAGPWKDPCPCHCVCIPFSWVFPIFATFSGLTLGVERLLKPDLSYLGVSDAWEPTPVVGPPNGWLDQLMLDARQSLVPDYGTPANVAAGSIGAMDSVAPGEPLDVAIAPVAEEQTVAAGLSQVGESVARYVLPTPIGPGPGIRGVGAQPLYPADGSRFEASPGALFAGVAPATDGSGFGSFRERFRPKRRQPSGFEMRK